MSNLAPPDSVALTASESGDARARGKYKYRLPDLLGKGAFAMVFRGRCLAGPHVGRAVAIKRIDKSKLMHDARLQRVFRTEISILQQLGSHLHVVEMLDYFESRDGQYVHLVLELCDRGDLGDYLRRRAPLPGAHVADVTRQLAAGMRYLRSRHVVHRDLKPQNVLLHADATRPCGHLVKITDFGFSTRMEQQDLTATFCGSPLHMAPEILMGGSYDPKIDLFSLGTIVYTMAVGREPFPAQSIKDLRTKINRAARAARALPLPPGMDPALADLLRGLLRIDPQARLSFDAFFRHEYLHRPLVAADPATAPSSPPPLTSTPSPPPISTAAGSTAARSAVPRVVPTASVVEVDGAPDTHFYIVDRYAVEFSDLLARLADRPVAQRVPADTEREISLCRSVRQTLTKVNHIYEIAQGLPASTPRGRAERLLLHGCALVMLRATVCDTREQLRQLQVRPTLATLTQGERFRAALQHCLGQINALRPVVARDDPSEGMHRALPPEDLLWAAAQGYVERAESLQARWLAPTDAQWRLRQSLLVGAQELLGVLTETLHRPGQGADSVGCADTVRLDRQLQHVAEMLRRSKPIPVSMAPATAPGSAPTARPPNDRFASPSSSSDRFSAPDRFASSPGRFASSSPPNGRLSERRRDRADVEALRGSQMRARFCGACGVKYPGGADNYCPCCGAQRALLSSGGLSLLGQSPASMAKTIA